MMRYSSLALACRELAQMPSSRSCDKFRLVWCGVACLRHGITSLQSMAWLMLHVARCCCVVFALIGGITVSVVF